MYLITQIGFALLTFAFYGLVLSELKKALNKSEFSEKKRKKILNWVGWSIAIWLGFISALSIKGFFFNFESFPPRLMIVLVVPLVTLIWSLLIADTTKKTSATYLF